LPPLGPPPPMPAPRSTTTDTWESLLSELPSLQSVAAANGPTASEQFGHYAACCFAIHASQNRDAPQECLICGGIHTFDDCPILKDHEFLKNHYIRACQMLKQDARHRPDLLAYKRRQTSAEVHQVGTQVTASDDGYATDGTDGSAGTVDFLSGRPAY
jgi:hypothetical protein